MSDWYPDDGIFDDEQAFDQELSKRLRTSLGAMGPSEEAESRMLANLLAAQAARVESESEPAEHMADPVVVERIPLADMPPVSTSGWGTSHGRRRVSRGARRRIVLAISACLVMAFGLGLLNAARQVGSDTASLKSHDVAMEESSEALEMDGYAMEEAPAEGALASSASSADAGAAADADDIVSSGGAFDVTTDPSYELVVGHPLVRLRTGELLRVVWHDGEPALVDGMWAEGLVGEAQAFAEDDEFDVVPCWVYALPVSDDGLYVVRYLEDGSFFAARIEE